MTIQLEKFKAGRLQAGTGYKYFLPEKINGQWQWADAQLNTLLEKASIWKGYSKESSLPLKRLRQCISK